MRLGRVCVEVSYLLSLVDDSVLSTICSQRGDEVILLKHSLHVG